MSNIYAIRRESLRKELKSVPYIVAAFDAMQQTNDAAAPFVQEANFFYLTGIQEPGWAVFVDAAAEEYLIAPSVSEVHRIFDGGLSNDEAKEVSGVKNVLDEKEGYALLSKIAETVEEVATIGRDPHHDHFSFAENPSIKRINTYVKKYAKSVKDIRPTVAAMRAIKDAEELKSVREAIAITSEAFGSVKQLLNSADNEYNLDASFTFSFRNQGVHHAYEPIIAAGVNACTLHYQKNETALPKNGLVLMDVGARVDSYAADITRTYAIGVPTPREIAVHAAVEKAHYEIISLLKPDLSIKEYHDKVDQIMKSALSGLGLLKNPSDYRKYFPHSISHGLGLDVHDALGNPKVFRAGMVLTVEPGIYIPEEGIGVRIEDDILITSNGHENLSGSLPTTL